MSENVPELDVRIDRVLSCLAACSLSDFERAREALYLESEDKFGELEHTVNLFIEELEQALAQRDAAHNELQTKSEQLEGQLRTIQQQRLAIRDLSAPILDIWEGVLTLPIVGTLDSQRAEDVTQALLHRLVESDARCVIIDLTGVDVVDSMTADHLVRLIRAASLLGTFSVVSGIGPEVARTLVDLGVDLNELRTLKTLRDGLRACVRHLQTQGGQSGDEVHS